ncbi:MAG: hypothetical protein M3295_02605, partial [Chloroflexota bacterium]|nr:hypothetical protein [Chloroflexota bacterium]
MPVSAATIGLILNLAVLGALPGPMRAADAVIVPTAIDGTSGCMGARTTPGSENTTLTVLDGDLRPGGWVIFELRFPVGEAEGREAFVVTDCVVIGGRAFEKYEIPIAANEYTVVFQLVIPADAPGGGAYCNYAKTTA